jgi:hypothetical protein
MLRVPFLFFRNNTRNLWDRYRPPYLTHVFILYVPVLQLDSVIPPKIYTPLSVYRYRYRHAPIEALGVFFLKKKQNKTTAADVTVIARKKILDLGCRKMYCLRIVIFVSLVFEISYAVSECENRSLFCTKLQHIVNFLCF